MTIARQGNERENTVTSNQTTLDRRGSRPAACATPSNVGLEVTSEEQFAPTLTGLGTRAPVDIFNPNPHDPVIGYAPRARGAFSRRATRTRSRSTRFDSVELSDRWQVSGGLRWEHYDTELRSRWTPRA